ncbi:hypothetical protein GEOBRER4_n0929 [Citrifermentans bremense]|uniref:Uncharacterized protein n=1 Tax=Citrifermentans bremense TaxID=60035 RepID=A0A6S6M468_9BACT|nr:hypothetical protein [Citrifermentans bremense]BCG46145.1 hypothetical protein GEOBRER4_n0929 [Citrifermentans bremense]
MKTVLFKTTRARLALVLVASGLLGACASVSPSKVDVKLPETAPVQKITSYTQALRNLGLMTEIYDTGALKIQSNPIGDNTGTAMATGGEIPKDITEMIKSALNSIGGNVVFIPYDPAFIQNQMATGYSNFDKKLIPDVVVSGGITEFDRGLETRGSGVDLGAEGEVPLKVPVPSNRIGLDYSNQTKTGLARITLDFNLLDFRTMAGIARMNTVNSMEVTKALSEKEIGVTLFGPTFGSKGSVKKVQGRHNAVRLLVEASMIQIVGKNLAIPYWRLIDDDAQSDEVVLSAVKKSYYRMNDFQRNHNVQQWLYLHGYDCPVTGNLDDATRAAIKQFRPAAVVEKSVDVDTFVQLYLSIPIDEKTLGRRMTLTSIIQAQAAPAPAPAPQAAAPPEGPYAHLSAEERRIKSTEAMIEAGRNFRQRNYGKASEYFAENLKILPSPETYFYLGLCQKEMKDEAGAAATLLEGTVKFPQDPLLWKSLGLLEYEKGDIGSARKSLSEALRLSPDDRQAKFLLDRLDTGNRM